ncbi:hypothetical protein [Microbulbifer sp. ALW1]|uniref:hypothetical protein n=1 Tax=Microbulbifer sp. (strain ALW1) TaxID=1516059 RepID=UPI001358E480|nr:hypothetical protein [Microbulbifer sp. ALW1]
MPREKSDSEKAAGKLISAIQKEWNEEAGTPQAEQSEGVMDLAHELLQARTGKAMEALLASRSISEYLGEFWVRRHPSVSSAVHSLEQAIEQEHA